MNQEQVLSIVRQVLLVAGGGLVTKGYVDEATLTATVGAAIVLLGSGWALYTRRTAGLVASAAAQPSVSKIVADPSVASAVPSLKVVPPAGAL